MKKSAQRRRKHCTLAVVRRSQKISPRRRLPSRRPKFNQLETVTIPLPTDPVSWSSMHAISSYRDNRPTNKQTHKQTGAITIGLHCTAVYAQCNQAWVLKETLHTFW